jgi:fructose transport system substrate-binding protein
MNRSYRTAKGSEGRRARRSRQRWLAARPARPARVAGAALTAALTLGTLAACTTSSTTATSGGATNSKTVKVALILKTFTNPYFVSMEKSAKTDASKLGVQLTVSAGQTDGDTSTQITAIDNAISAGDQGILITPNGNAVNSAIAQARKAGLYVIALDTAPIPSSTVNITFETNNFGAGELIGKWTAAKLNGGKAVIAMLDLFNNQVVSVDINRDHGFLTGMGISPGNANLNGSEAKSGSYSKGSYQIACQQATQGSQDGGKSAMESCLSANPNINVVYAINEPAAEGAYAALQAAHHTKGVEVVTIDGACLGVQYIQKGEIDATSGQFPGKMAGLGVQAIDSLVKNGTKPQVTPGLDYYNTGTELYTNQPQSGVSSVDSTQASNLCWGSAS